MGEGNETGKVYDFPNWIGKEAECRVCEKTFIISAKDEVGRCSNLNPNGLYVRCRYCGADVHFSA